MKNTFIGRGWRALFVTVVVVVCACLLAGTVALQYSIDDDSAVRANWRKSSPFDSALSFLDIMGGFRQALAAYFWTKTDDIWHEFFGGDITREEAQFPYYWMITRLDPHFVMAYYFASWFLCRFGQPEEGFRLALEGLRNNPTSARLQENLAQIYLFFRKEPRKALYHIERAIKLAEDEEDLAVYANFKKLTEDVIEGRKQLPPLRSLEEMKELGKELEEHEHHEHRHRQPE